MMTKSRGWLQKLGPCVSQKGGWEGVDSSIEVVGGLRSSLKSCSAGGIGVVADCAKTKTWSAVCWKGGS